MLKHWRDFEHDWVSGYFSLTRLMRIINRGVKWRLIGLVSFWLSVVLGGFCQTADSFNPQPDSFVSCLGLQSDGSVVIGGSFTKVGTNTAPRLARVRSDGTLDPNFGGTASNSVATMAIQEDGKIVVGGSFSNLCGHPRGFLGRLNPDGGFDAGFNPTLNTNVLCLALQSDGKILVGGSFTNVNGVPRARLVRLNPDGTTDGEFVATSSVDVLCLQIQPDGKILVGATGGGIARLKANGSNDTSFQVFLNSVYAIAVQPDGKILIGGSFNTGNNQSYLCRVSSTGALDNTFKPGANGLVNSITLQLDGSMLVGGQFSSFSGKTANGFAKITSGGLLDTNFVLSSFSLNSVVVQPDGKVLVGGLFSSLNGQSRKNLGRLVSATATVTSDFSFNDSTITWLRGGSGAEAARTTFEIASNNISWTRLGDAVRLTNGWQLSGLTLPPNPTLRLRAFGAVGTGSGSPWMEETNTGPAMFVGPPLSRTNNASTTAFFTVAVGGSRPISYQWRKDGQDLLDGGNILGTTTTSLTLSNVLSADGGGYSVVASNSFGSITSQVAILTVVDPVILGSPHSLATNGATTVELKVLTAGTPPLALQWRKDGMELPGATGASLVITNTQLQDTGVYDVVVTNYIGSVTSSTANLFINSSDDFNPGANGTVRALTVQRDGKIIVGGTFMTLGGQSQTNIGRLNADGTLDVNFRPNIGSVVGNVQCIAVQTDDKILVAGSSNLKRLLPNGATDTSFNGAASPNLCLLIQTDGKILIGRSSMPYLARLNTDGSMDTNFNAQLSFYDSPSASGVHSIIPQPNGKILVGGSFTIGNPQRIGLARLNQNGSLDLPFYVPLVGDFVGGGVSPPPPVYCLLGQPDGKFLVSGDFVSIGGQNRVGLARLYPDGTVDSNFPLTNSAPITMCLQADGKILAGGSFQISFGSRNRIKRLNSDGSLDDTFNPGANQEVDAIALQADGKILVGGQFTTLGGASRSSLGRLFNTGPASQNLTFSSSQIQWLQSGTGPAGYRAEFEGTLDGAGWFALGSALPIPGGWTLSGISNSSISAIRARAWFTGSMWGGSEWFQESTLQVIPKLSVDGLGTGWLSNQFGFNLISGPGQTVVIESSTNLLDWAPLSTNTLTTNILFFDDQGASDFSSRFYRARVQ
jgi:uncharacterized delta-60 repeat protein